MDERVTIDMNKRKDSTPLDRAVLQTAATKLCAVDADLGMVVDQFGFPPLWDRNPGFPTLIHIILEQQVSLASAKAAFTKLEQASGKVTPQRFLRFSDQELKQIGFSRQKALYGRELSQAILSGELDLPTLAAMEDADVRTQLLKIKGIGNWTADIYLLMVLLRPDIWPLGDLALVKGLMRLKRLDQHPSHETQLEIAEAWRPWRAVAARIVWHYYLSVGL